MFLAETTSHGWRPGIGDPTFMGWFTVFAYLFAAFLCWRAWRNVLVLRLSEPFASPARRAGLPRFWFILASAFILLSINKQLDLQSLFTQIGRDLARQSGWYGSRQQVQIAFIIALTALGAGAIGWQFWSMRGSFRTHGLAMIGTIFIVSFVVIRAASFHHFDEFLGWEILGFEMNWMLELAGIGCVAIAAWRSRSPANRSSLPPKSDGLGNPESSSAMSRRKSFRWMAERASGE